MHVRLRLKMESLASSKNTRYGAEKINEYLQMAQDALVKSIAVPRYADQLRMMGFEATQRNREDIKNIVVDDYDAKVEVKGDISYGYLPPDYLAHAASYFKVSGCNKRIRGYDVQKDELHEENPFSRSSAQWMEINMEFIEKSRVKIYYPVEKYLLSYIRIPKKIWWTEKDYIGLDGELVSGEQNCELDTIIHDDIVDFAAYLMSYSKNSSDLPTKLNHIKNIGI